jgi:hypothetical protein
VRSPVAAVGLLSIAGLVALILGPIVSLTVAAVLLVGGIVGWKLTSNSDSRTLGVAAVGTGIALVAATVALLAITDRHQDKPVRLGPDTGFETSP